MSPLAPLSPEALELMTDVYRRAVHELKLDGAPKKERDRLAVYIFAVGSSVDDPHRMLDRAMRMYHRVATVHDLPVATGNASSPCTIAGPNDGS
jgi:hypothetical protein